MKGSVLQIGTVKSFFFRDMGIVCLCELFGNTEFLLYKHTTEVLYDESKFSYFLVAFCLKIQILIRIFSVFLFIKEYEKFTCEE